MAAADASKLESVAFFFPLLPLLLLLLFALKEGFVLVGESVVAADVSANLVVQFAGVNAQQRSLFSLDPQVQSFALPVAPELWELEQSAFHSSCCETHHSVAFCQVEIAAKLADALAPSLMLMQT